VLLLVGEEQVGNQANTIDDMLVAIKFNLRELELVSFQSRHSHLIEFDTRGYWTAHPRHFSFRFTPLVLQLSSTYYFLRMVIGDSGEALQCIMVLQMPLFEDALSVCETGYLQAMNHGRFTLRRRSTRSADTGNCVRSVGISFEGK